MRGIGVALSVRHVHLEAQRLEQLLLRDAEALLLVEDHEAELLRDHVAREDAVRADEDVDLAGAEVGEDPLRVLRRDEARDHLDADREVAVALAERVEVLLGEDRRRREEQRLLAVHRDGERGAHGDLRLAEADVTADEAIHRARRLEVFHHRLDRGRLVGRLAEREDASSRGSHSCERSYAMPSRVCALRVERDELAGELADGLLRARLHRLPRLAAELRERRRAGVGADVARDLAELLVRDVEPVLAAEREQEIVARHARDRLRLEAEELADAVVLVDDVVAGAEVGEALERAAAEAALARGAAAEDLVVGQDDEAEVAPDEAAARGRDGEQELRLLRQILARLEHARLDAAEEVLRAQRLAAVRERDDDALAGADERRELELGLGEAARRDRRLLRLERERLVLRERIELGRAVERRRAADAVLLPDAAHGVRLEDEVGRAGERRDEVVGHLDRRLVARLRT